MRTAPALHASNVVKRYGAVTALDSVTVAVDAAECVALVGESGSGKSTLLRCFNRMVEPDSGHVSVDGTNVAERDPVALRRGIGYVQQESGLLPHWTALRNVSLVPWLNRSADARERAAHALQLVGLSADAFGARHPRELSGGQRQRVAIARAIAHSPAILLMDEPFGALDAITRADLQQLFMDLRAELRVTVLLVTHDLHEALLLANRIVVLRDGRVEQDADGAELLQAPATEYVARLLQRARVHA